MRYRYIEAWDSYVPIPESNEPQDWNLDLKPVVLPEVVKTYHGSPCACPGCVKDEPESVKAQYVTDALKWKILNDRYGFAW